MRPAMSYTPYTTSLRDQTGYIITFTYFEEGNLLYETRDYTESGDESDDDSTMPPLLAKEKWMRCIQAMSLMMNLYLQRC